MFLLYNKKIKCASGLLVRDIVQYLHTILDSRTFQDYVHIENVSEIFGLSILLKYVRFARHSLPTRIYYRVLEKKNS